MQLLCETLGHWLFFASGNRLVIVMSVKFVRVGLRETRAKVRARGAINYTSLDKSLLIEKV